MAEQSASSASVGEASPMRAFLVERRIRESDLITSFVLQPLDGGAPLPHEAGQHLSLFVDIPAVGRQKRNYTISSAPNGRSYRISVKREPGGTVSRWLHDHVQPGTRVEVGAPGGSFVVGAEAKRPVVLLSAGVGQTPMVAMIEAVAAAGCKVPVHFIHCARNGGAHAFGGNVRETAAAGSAIVTTFFYTQPGPDDAAQGRFDIEGRVSIDWVAAHTPVHDADYFICGPLPFLKTFVNGLARLGVPPDRLHYEFFGPVDDLFEDDGAGQGAPPSPAKAPPGRMSQIAAGFTRAQIGDTLIDSAADAVVVSDAQGAIVLWNPGAERIFGFSEQEALGQSLDIIIPEPFRARHWDGYRETVASGQSRYGAGDLLAVPGLRRDGRRISIEFTIVLIKDQSAKVIGMAATIRDVSARFEETKALKKKVAELEARGA